MFISFEGIEGSGKSTLMAAIDRALRNEGRSTLVTREPGGTPLGDAVRALLLQGEPLAPMSEVLLINASRAQLVEQVVRPALRAGTAVLCDRFVHSTLAYQGFGRGLPLEIVRAVCDAATGDTTPDITFLLDIPYELSRARLTQRGGALDRIEAQDRAFHERVREGYLHLAQRDERIVLLDGSQDAQQVADAAFAALSALPT